ncbi:FkbM family methyltransferase [Brachyspira pilosicoli]
MDKKVIDNIVWWIPFKKLRNAIRNYIVEKNNLNDELKKIIYHNNQLLYSINNTLYNSIFISSNQFVNDLLKDKRYEDKKRLERFGYKVYSQNDEDGIINEIFNRIGTTNKFFVEFGVQTGLECNSHYLLFNGWNGVFIEGSEYYYNMIIDKFRKPIEEKRLEVLNRFIDAENINDILSETKAIKIKDIDLLSIDIDGNDYHVFKSINVINPRVVIIEYNSKFPPPSEWIMPYNPKHIWDNSDNQGVSLQSISNLADKKGYQLVGTNLNGINAFFVRKDLCKDKFCDDCSALNLYNSPKYDIFRLNAHPSKYFLNTAKDE